MKKAATVGAVIAALVIGFLIWRRGDSHSSAATKAAPADAAVAAAPMEPAPELPIGAVVGEVPPEPEEFAVDPERNDQVAAIHHEILVAASPCYRHRAHPPAPTEPGAPDETMQELRVRYSVVIQGARATLANISADAPDDPANTMGTPLQDEDLAACILDALTQVEVGIPADDETFTIVDTITVGDLDLPEPAARSPKPPMPEHPEKVAPLAKEPTAP